MEAFNLSWILREDFLVFVPFCLYSKWISSGFFPLAVVFWNFFKLTCGGPKKNVEIL